MKTSRRLPSDFSLNAAYPLYAIDPAQDRAWVLHFDREDYRRATFLDQRALQHRAVSGWTVTAEELAEAAQPAPPMARLHWLFHIGHCGSTLASRLLDLIPGTLGLREPLPLLVLAHERQRPDAGAWLESARPLLARGFADTQAVVVKPTSVVTTLADQLLPDTGSACLLWVDLQTWLATMLREEGLAEAPLATEGLRLQDVQVSAPATGRSERLARLWLAEQRRWSRLKQHPSFSSRLFDMNFAEVLADPAGALQTLAGRFGLRVPADLDARIAGSRILQRYAKDPSQPFEAHNRDRELTHALERNRAEIEEGVRWASQEFRRGGELELESKLRPGPRPGHERNVVIA